jgi:hypothetical protein
MDGYEIDNLIHAGVFFGVYLFVMICVFFFMSGPVDTMLSGFGSVAEGTISEPYMNSFLPGIRQAIWMVFAIGMSIPITWFIFWVFSRDPFQGLVKRY